LQESRSQLEVNRLKLEKEVHLALIDTLYETQAEVSFNEVTADSVEFRFYVDEVVQKHTAANAIVIGSQNHVGLCNSMQAKQKGTVKNGLTNA